MAKRIPRARPAQAEVRLDVAHVTMDDMDYYMFTDPDYPDIMITASNPQSLAEWLRHVIMEAFPNLAITGFTVLHVKPGGRRTFPRTTHDEGDEGDEDDGDTGNKGA